MSMRVIVKDGRHVRHPVTRQILAPGTVLSVAVTPYWTRRLQDQDIAYAPKLAPVQITDSQ